MWSDTKTPWEDLAKEDMERINAWLHGVACNWSFLEKTVSFTEFGHLGGIYWQEGGNNKDVVWVTEKELIKTTVFKKTVHICPYSNRKHYDPCGQSGKI